jgi:hypothetical protein
VTVRQTNIVWVAFVTAVSIVRLLKEADVVQAAESNEPPVERSWLMFDPLAADAEIPGINSVLQR